MNTYFKRSNETALHREDVLSTFQSWWNAHISLIRFITELFCIFSSSFPKKSLVSQSSLLTYSNAYMEKLVKGGKHRNLCWAGIWQWNSLQWQQGTDSLLILNTSGMGHRTFPKSFLQSCFESPCLGATNRTKPGAQGRELPTFWRGARVPQGALCLIHGLILKLHQLRYWKSPLVFFLCAVTRRLSECHPNLCNAAGSPVQQDCNAPGGQEMMFIYLPVTFSTGLFDLISALPAVQIFPYYVPFPPRCWWVSSTFPGYCRQVTELTKCFSQQLLAPAETSSAPHWAAPPQSSIQPLNTRETRILRLDVSPSSLNNNPAWAQMSCQAGWWCCFKFTIIYFSNLISKMEMHISAHDFQLISDFLSAFQCCWNALCYRQNTLIMMGLFFQQLPLSNVTHRENEKLPLPSCVKHLKRREEKELVVKTQVVTVFVVSCFREEYRKIFLKEFRHGKAPWGE